MLGDHNIESFIQHLVANAYRREEEMTVEKSIEIRSARQHLTRGLECIMMSKIGTTSYDDIGCR